MERHINLIIYFYLLDTYIKDIVKNQLNKRNNNFINAHNVEEFKKENKREWIEINKILSCFTKNQTILEYPDW